MPQKYNIEFIAKEAGVGRGTVSRVLNNHPSVSEKTRNKVLEVIERLDYRPSAAARYMRTQRSNLIGFISDEVATAPYAGDLILGAQDAGWEYDQVILAVSAGENFNRLDAVVEIMLERDVDGIIFSAGYHRKIRVPQQALNIPTVFANCFAAQAGFASAVPDEYRGGFEATQQLLEAGHRRVAFINVNTLESGLPAAIGRYAGYRDALAAYGLAVQPELARSGQPGNAPNGYETCMELMRLPEPPTAIFAGTDRMAMGCYNALHRLGLSVPDDVAIVGFDNQANIAEALMPPLSTMQLPHYDMGFWAVEYLNELINDPDVATTEQRLLHCAFVPRESHRKP